MTAQTTPTDVTFDNTSTHDGGGSSSGLYGHNVSLFNVLRAINNVSGALTGTNASYLALNSRQIVYFESKDVKTVSHSASGFIPAQATGVKGNPKNTNVIPVVGDLVDPWGNLYYVRIDANYSGMCGKSLPNRHDGFWFLHLVPDVVRSEYGIGLYDDPAHRCHCLVSRCRWL